MQYGATLIGHMPCPNRGQSLRLLPVQPGKRDYRTHVGTSAWIYKRKHRNKKQISVFQCKGGKCEGMPVCTVFIGLWCGS